MDYRARAGATTRLSQPGAAIAHCRMHPSCGQSMVTSRPGEQPLVHAPTGVTVAFDGFLANHAALYTELAMMGASLSSAEDAELVLHAFLAWGAECAVQLEGEFAALVWDPRTREVHGLRDHHGLRPLYYWHHDEMLIVASEIAAVLAAMPRDPPLNRGYLAEVAVDMTFSAGETVWQGIRRVPPAHVLHARRGQLAMREYWTLATGVTLPIRSDDEYVEAYREVLTESVRQAARSAAPVACEVSGGLDSSAVFAMAHHLAGQGDLPAPAVRGFTLAGPAGSPADEVAHARAVGRHLGCEIHESPLFMPELEWFARQARRDRDAPPWPNAAMSLELERAAVEAGCRVLLGGIGGDQWLDGSEYHYRELLGAAAWRQLGSQFAADLSDRGWRETIPLFLHRGPATWLPTAMRKKLRARGSTLSLSERALTWLQPDLLGELKRREADYEASFPPEHHASYKLRKLKHPLWTRILDQAARQRARSGLEMRSPMMARRFIEFSAATPEHTRLRGRTAKYVHRHALAGLLPESVLARRDKAEFSASYFCHDADLEEYLSGSAPARLEALFVPGGVAQLLETYLATPIDERYPAEIWGTYTCGLLLQFETGLGHEGHQ